MMYEIDVTLTTIYYNATARYYKNSSSIYRNFLIRFFFLKAHVRLASFLRAFGGTSTTTRRRRSLLIYSTRSIPSYISSRSDFHSICLVAV